MTLIDRGTGAIVYRVDNTVEIMPPKFRSTCAPSESCPAPCPAPYALQKCRRPAVF